MFVGYKIDTQDIVFTNLLNSIFCVLFLWIFVEGFAIMSLGHVIDVLCKAH